MERTAPLTEQLREWYEHSPTAQRAFTRFRADVDTVVARVQPMMDEFWEKVGPIIDPPAEDAPRNDAPARDTTSHTTSDTAREQDR